MTRVVRDYTAGRLLTNEAELARDLRIVIEKLGPTFIKVKYSTVICCTVWNCNCILRFFNRL